MALGRAAVLAALLALARWRAGRARGDAFFLLVRLPAQVPASALHMRFTNATCMCT